VIFANWRETLNPSGLPAKMRSGYALARLCANSLRPLRPNPKKHPKPLRNYKGDKSKIKKSALSPDCATQPGNEKCEMPNAHCAIGLQTPKHTHKHRNTETLNH